MEDENCCLEGQEATTSKPQADEIKSSPVETSDREISKSCENRSLTAAAVAGISGEGEGGVESRKEDGVRIEEEKDSQDVVKEQKLLQKVSNTMSCVTLCLF